MAAKASGPLTFEDAEVRLCILELASEDCYGVKEFINSVLALYTVAQPSEKLAMAKRVLAQLSDEGLVRLHGGRQCSGTRRATEDLTIRGADVAGLPDDVWVPYTESIVCVCSTELTLDAWNAAWLAKNGAGSA